MKKIALVIFFVIIFLTCKAVNAETYKGDLIIEGKDVYMIEDKDDFHVDGNIIVKDNAKLIIRNSKVTIDITSFTNYWIYVYDNAILEVYDSTLDRAKEVNANLRMQGKKLIMKNSKSYLDLSAEGGIINIENSNFIGSNGIFWKGDQSVDLTLKDSHVKGVQLSFLSNDPDSISINGLKPGKKTTNIKTTSGASLNVVGSTVDAWIIEQFEFFDKNSNKVDLTVKDSEIYLWLWFRPGSTFIANNLKPGFFSDWKLSRDTQIKGVDYDVHLVNTKVGGEKVAEIKLHLVGNAVLNSVIAQIATWGNADVLINNSRIEAGLMLRGNETVYIHNTNLAKGLIEFIDGKNHIEDIGAANHKVYFSNSKITARDFFEVVCENSFIGGDVEIAGPDLSMVSWERGVIVREYPAVSNPNSSIVLYDQNNKVIWKGLADKNGFSAFNITFNKDNYKQKWRIESQGNLQEVQFLTSTPINLKVSAPETPETDRFVNQTMFIIILIIIVFIGFVFLWKRKDWRREYTPFRQYWTFTINGGPETFELNLYGYNYTNYYLD